MITTCLWCEVNLDHTSHRPCVKGIFASLSCFSEDNKHLPSTCFSVTHSSSESIFLFYICLPLCSVQIFLKAHSERVNLTNRSFWVMSYSSSMNRQLRCNWLAHFPQMNIYSWINSLYFIISIDIWNSACDCPPPPS